MANKLIEALDPRVPIYRDTYNEYFVLVLSAGGAVAGPPVPLDRVMAITDLCVSLGTAVHPPVESSDVAGFERGQPPP